MSMFSDVPKGSPVVRTFARDRAKPLGRKIKARDVPHVERQKPVLVATGASTAVDKVGEFLEFDFRRVSEWLRAGMKGAIVLALLGGLAGGAYGLLSKRLYTVGTDILINPSNLQVVANDLYAAPSQGDNQVLAVRSKLRVLTSRNVLLHVVDELDLTRDSEFNDPSPGLFSFLSGSGAAASDPRTAVLEVLSKRIETKADETSFVASLSVSAETVDKAIRISQAVVTGFQDELAKAESDGASRAARAIDDRLDQLKQDVQAAEAKVEAYRRANNLASSQGQLVSSQSMTQVNSEMITAQSRVIAAQAAYDAVLAAGPNATTQDSVASTSLAALRTRASNLQQELDGLSMTYGPRYPRLVQLRAELEAANGQIKTELSRILAKARSNLEEAKASFKALDTRMKDMTGTVFTDNEVQVALRELERDAASKTAVYESFLARAHQITEREQIDTTNVRVISTAVPPQSRSWPPRTSLLIVAGTILGLAAGLFLALARGMLRELREPQPAAAEQRA